MATVSPRTRSTSCCSTETRFRASAWRRSRRCRGSRTQSTAARSTAWPTSWPRGSSSGIAAVWTGGRGASRSIWTRRTTRRHGAQQYTLFNGYYDNWCYLPLLGFLTFDRESEQYLCAALLRHGKAVASEGTVGLLSRLLPRLRRAFPRARILVRLDGGFASPAVFDFLEAQPRLDYVVAMAKNAVLERYARAGHAGGAGADVAQRTDRARLHRDQRVPGRPRGTTRAAS